MPGSDETVVVAVIGAGPALAEAAIAAWDEGAAILPLNPAAPRAELDRLLERLRPAVIVEAGERHLAPDGVPAPGDTAAIVVT